MSTFQAVWPNAMKCRHSKCLNLAVIMDSKKRYDPNYPRQKPKLFNMADMTRNYKEVMLTASERQVFIKFHGKPKYAIVSFYHYSAITNIRRAMGRRIEELEAQLKAATPDEAPAHEEAPAIVSPDIEAEQDETREVREKIAQAVRRRRNVLGPSGPNSDRTPEPILTRHPRSRSSLRTRSTHPKYPALIRSSWSRSTQNLTPWPWNLTKRRQHRPSPLCLLFSFRPRLRSRLLRLSPLTRFHIRPTPKMLLDLSR